MIDEDRAVFAVLGDPAEDRYVQAFIDHDDMADLIEAADACGELFYCSRKLGGCGEKVMPVNGRIRRPHFRHFAHSTCRITPAENRDIYTHAIVQYALVTWLRAHGHPEADVEKRLDRCSRVDVFCTPHSVIEVQLSGETDVSMRNRTRRYGEIVTWLFDPSNPISSRDATLDRDGVVRLVRVRPAPEERLRRTQTMFSKQPIDIGVRSAASNNDRPDTDWFPLEECTFTPEDGLQPLRLAYADPPYPGLSRQYYSTHPDFAGEVDHVELTSRLASTYDGWTINFRDGKSGGFQKNLTNRRADLLVEATILHRRFPYAVIAAFFFLDKDAATTARSAGVPPS